MKQKEKTENLTQIKQIRMEPIISTLNRIHWLEGTVFEFYIENIIQMPKHQSLQTNTFYKNIIKNAEKFN